MSRVCQITGKRPITGNNGLPRQQPQRRRFLPNLHRQRFWLETEERWVSLRVSDTRLRTIEKKGIEKVVAELRAAGRERLSLGSGDSPCVKRSNCCRRPTPATST